MDPLFPDPLRAERVLVERMLDGDERAMEQFADEYFPPLYRFARSRLGGDGELARDLAQTTVCKALSKLSSYRGDAPLATWLCACCRNEILMYFRQRGRQPPQVDLDGDPEGEAGAWCVEPTEPVIDSLVRREDAQRVHSALDALPPRYAQALEWKYLERCSVGEIAARLGLGAKAAESLLTRARGAFREGYQRLLFPREVRL